MDPTLQLIINIGALCGAVATIVGLPVAIVKGWPFLKRFVAIVTAAEKLPEMASEIKEQSSTLETIRHELFPNSGKSLRDAVDQQGKKLDEQGQKLDDHMKNCPAPQAIINVNPGVSP